MRVKLKLCNGCDTDKRIWKNYEGECFCKTCWQRKNPVYIKPIADKQQANLERYYPLRDEYLKRKDRCEFPGCSSTNVELHHKKTREYHLCDVDVFMSVCRHHHNWIHDNDELSRSLGYLLSSI